MLALFSLASPFLSTRKEGLVYSYCMSCSETHQKYGATKSYSCRWQTWGKHFVKCLKHKFKHFQKGLKHKYKHMCFIKKVLEAQFQALAKGLKHKHKHFLSEYIFPSFRYRNRKNVESFITFYCIVTSYEHKFKKCSVSKSAPFGPKHFPCYAKYPFNYTY